MVYIIPDVLVTIAEHADSQSMLNLMLTCRRFHDVLQYHERSIVKARLAAYCRNAIDPRVFLNSDSLKGHPLLRLHGHNDGTVLIANSHGRTVARPYSYAVIKELEVREARSHESIVSCLARHGRSSDRDNLDLVRAWRVADLIGDCLARVVARADWIDGYNAHLDDDHDLPVPCSCPCSHLGYGLVEPLSTYITGVRNHRLLDTHVPPLNRGQRDFDTNTVLLKLAITVREAQLAIIKELSQWDLVHLSWLTEVAGATFTGLTPKGTWLSDPDHLEKRTAYQECVLRQGPSHALWASTRDESAPAGSSAVRLMGQAQVQWAVSVVCEEMFLWETGHGTGLVSVNRAFPPVKDPKLASVLKAFDKEIEDSTEEPRDVADNQSEDSLPAMRPGLQMTTVTTLCDKMDTQQLSTRERDFAQMLRPHEEMST